MVEDRGRAPSSSSVSKKGGSGSGGLGGGSGGQVPASYLEPGARLEARDPSNEQWFPVKVEDSDKEAKEVSHTPSRGNETTCRHTKFAHLIEICNSLL